MQYVTYAVDLVGLLAALATLVLMLAAREYPAMKTARWILTFIGIVGLTSIANLGLYLAHGDFALLRDYFIGFMSWSVMLVLASAAYAFRTRHARELTSSCHEDGIEP